MPELASVRVAVPGAVCEEALPVSVTSPGVNACCSTWATSRALLFCR
jgi:hypothetical protein